MCSCKNRIHRIHTFTCYLRNIATAFIAGDGK